IGRGTSTFDGLALAWASARHLAERAGALTLFATHYFELTALAEEIDGVANVHLDAVEHQDRLVFLHALKPGPASRSFGLQVARLAGLPDPVLALARGYLDELEGDAASAGARPAAAQPKRDSGPQLSLFPSEAPALTRLRQIDPDSLSPRQALELLYELRQQL
ncbi:MAG: DNA mismatch repair protein MutS, partial [Xanthomonadales bacterium]|nr:DNA mismatch repair protein MutS [Xanthomonadales bacterium]